MKKNTQKLFIGWLGDFMDKLPHTRSVLRIQRAEPRFQTRNYFARFKVATAVLDGSG